MFVYFDEKSRLKQEGMSLLSFAFLVNETIFTLQCRLTKDQREMHASPALSNRKRRKKG